MGCFAVLKPGGPSYLQLIAAMLKVPALFFLTLVVTFPSLYVFNALVGSRLSVGAVLRLLLAALAVMVTVLASLGPIVAFFSVSTTTYAFMQLINVLAFGVSGLLGLIFFLRTLERLSIVPTAQGPVDAEEPLAPDRSEHAAEDPTDPVHSSASGIRCWART
jgi:hypothetical protein